MKWIRTECGVIGVLIKDEVHINHHNINGKLYRKEHQGHKIKKQGDNFIDVLEKGKDIVINKTTKERFTIVTKRGNVVHLIPFDGSNWKISNDINLMRCYDIITHEQYMPLAQEVNNETSG